MVKEAAKGKLAPLRGGGVDLAVARLVGQGGSGQAVGTLLLGLERFDLPFVTAAFFLEGDVDGFALRIFKLEFDTVHTG